MKKLVLGIFFSFLMVGKAVAQDMMPPDKNVVFGYPVVPESENYTYSVKDDGKAQVWLRVDGVNVPASGGEYKLILPESMTGEVTGSYRENGCSQYQNGMCISQGNGWRVGKVAMNGREMTLTIPPRKISKLNEEIPMTLGFTWGTTDITTKKWWGREVKIVTAKPKQQIVSYMNVGVYMPEGVYSRDIQQGPGGWGQMMSEFANKRLMAAEAPQLQLLGAAQNPSAMLDMAGGGTIYRSKNNLMPGEGYSFSFISSTSIWKLYLKEIGWSLVYLLAIAIVLALLLFMIIGKKSILWYSSVVALIAMLFVLIGGLWVVLNLGVTGGGNYPIPMSFKGADMSVTPPVGEMAVPGGLPATEDPGLTPELLPASVPSN